jgi:hypothetical protein
MDLRNFEHSLWVGISFGLASGVLTSLGLLVGLAIGTKLVVASSFLVPVLVVAASALVGRWVAATFA